MRGVTFFLLVVTFIQSSVDSSTTPPSDSEAAYFSESDITGPVVSDTDCVLDDDGTNPWLERCITLGEEFLESYVDFLKRSNKRRRQFDTCSAFSAYGACVSPLLSACASVRHVLRRHWSPVIELLNCACAGPEDETRTQCKHDLECFEHEYSGLMVKRCDAFYRFNKKQKTRGRCHFLRENINCKDALITSSCGEATGNFGYHFSKLVHKRHIEDYMCYVERNHQYEGFRYTESCDRTLEKNLDMCHREHLTEMLDFYKDNDLIASEGRKMIKRACRHYSHYKQCLVPVEQSCPEGYTQYFDYEGKLRRYMLKMDYICDEVKDEYLRYVPCYKDVYRNKTLDTQCPWDGLDPYVGTVSSFDFYCNYQKKTAMDMHLALENQRHCIETVFSHKCGSESGSVMSELIRRVFQDPNYLRFTFKPDCELHRTTTTTSTTTTTTVTSTTLSQNVLSRSNRFTNQNVPASHSKSGTVSVKMHFAKVHFWLTIMFIYSML